MRLRLAFAAVAISISAANAEPLDPERPLLACRQERLHFCRGVEPGGGRIIQCLWGHPQALSPDCREALVAMQDAAKLLRMGDEVTGIRLNLLDPYAAPRIVRAAAIALGGGFTVQDWTNEHVNFFRSIEITKRILFVILSLVVAVAAFNIVSTMVMVVKDKRRDIAILRTFGSSPGSILSVFVVQGSLIGLLGIAFGVALGVLISVNLQDLVHGLESILGFKFLDARVYFMSDLPAHVRLADVLRICGVAFVLACMSTLYPAWRAARLLPAESLRND